MSEFVDDEIENYQAKYGFIDSYDTHFDDIPELGQDYLKYKIEKIKIWTADKKQSLAIGGIQTVYVNNKDGSKIISEEHKGEKVEEKNFAQFNLSKNEYINKCTLWFQEGCINRIEFKTNLLNTFSAGDANGNPIEVDELDKNRIVLAFFGTYNNNYLSSIGLFRNKLNQFFNYFLLGYFLIRDIMNIKEKRRDDICKKYEKKEYEDDIQILIKACMLPKSVFNTIMKFVPPL